jgi:hypothetical protein
VSLTVFLLVVSREVNVFVSVDALTEAENPQPLKPAEAETESEVSFP